MPTRSAVSFLSRARVPLPLCPFVSLPSANATIASGLSAAMPAQEQNYWLETINAPSVEAAPDLPENVDVAIVGGGFCGLSAETSANNRDVDIFRQIRRRFDRWCVYRFEPIILFLSRHCCAQT